MDVRDLNESTLVDLFGTAGAQGGGVTPPAFGGSEQNIDLFSSITDTTTIPVSTTETTTAKPVEDNGNTDVEVSKEGTEADILGQNGDESASRPGRKPKYDFSDISGYFQDRIKNGKFVQVTEEDDKGNKTPFIPKTPEEFDEVIDIQVNYKLEQEKKALEEKWYQTKSPAWQLVSKYAELVDDPAQLVPFIQGVNNIQSVDQLNAEELEGAERIVRIRLEERGEPDSIINSQIEALKSSDKLVSTAKELKPLMVQQEKNFLAQQLKQAEENERRYQQMVVEMREEAIKAIEQPIFGKNKMKQEEKAAVYNLIGEPLQEEGGYGIYTAIDNLFDKKDFDTLRQIALLLTKKDSFYSYLGTTVANQTASTLQKRLQVAGDSRSASGNDVLDDSKPIVSRNQFSKTPKFGR